MDRDLGLHLRLKLGDRTAHKVMPCEVEYTDEFGQWWQELSDTQQVDATAIVDLLAAKGTALPFPYSSGIKNSRHIHLRELRVQSEGNPLRIFYAFDPRRAAILLIGGDKTGKDRFYAQLAVCASNRYIPIADRLYDEYIEELRAEGLIE